MTLRNIWRASEAHPEGGDANKQEADTPEGETPVTLSVLQQGINQVRAVQRSADALVERARQEHLGPLIEAIKGVLEKLPSDEDTERYYRETREQLEKLAEEQRFVQEALQEAKRKKPDCRTPHTDQSFMDGFKHHHEVLVATTIDCAIRYQLWGILDLLRPEGPRSGEVAKRAGIKGPQITRPVAYVYNDTAPEHKRGSLFIEFNNNQPDSHIEVDTLDPAALCNRIRERLEELGVNGLIEVLPVPCKGPARGTTDILLSTELPTANSEQAPSGQPDQLGQAALRGSVYP